jgi:Transglutaminase-like superfamily
MCDNVQTLVCPHAHRVGRKKPEMSSITFIALTGSAVFGVWLASAHQLTMGVALCVAIALLALWIKLVHTWQQFFVLGTGELPNTEAALLCAPVPVADRLVAVIDQHGVEFVFNIHPYSNEDNSAANLPSAGNNGFMRLRTLSEMRAVVAGTPGETMECIYPRRYGQSERPLRLAIGELAKLWRRQPQVKAATSWINRRITRKPDAIRPPPRAIDSLIEQVGVCRDFEHLMIALCRAVDIPARIATGTDHKVDAAAVATDFDAYVELLLDDRWYVFDPCGTAKPMSFIRFGGGRDAGNQAFATIFGGVKLPLRPTTAMNGIKRTRQTHRDIAAHPIA